MSPALLARVFRVAADELDAIEAEQRQANVGWIDQRRSPLGAKRHCAAVRRLLADGLPGAAVVGRKHLLSDQALEAELQQSSSKSRKSGPVSVGDQLRAELRLVGGAR